MASSPPPPRGGHPGQNGNNGYYHNGYEEQVPSPLTAMLTDGITHNGQPAPPYQQPAPAYSAPPAPTQAPGTAASRPEDFEHLAEVPGLPGLLDTSVLASIKQEASRLLSEQAKDRMWSQADREQQARAIVRRLVADWAAGYAETARPLSREEEEAVRAAIFNGMFRAGPLQPYLDDDSVEDILLDGDKVVVEYHDKPRAEMPKLFTSQQALKDWVNIMAAKSGHGERQLSPATPSVGFRLPDGSRVTATTLTTQPAVAIRRHRIRNLTLADLHRLGTLSESIMHFLRASVESGRNILVAGEMGAGKTSLVRSLGRSIPASERIVTLESDRELYLDDEGADGPYTLAMEARQSNGERDDSGRLIGEVSIADMFPTALRLNATRIIVGEVRSVEIKPMLQAMAAGGSGSMCTIHVRRTGNIKEGVIGRLVQLCTEAGLSEAAAYRLIAAGVDLVVYIEMIDETAIGGVKHRFVSHIFEVVDTGEGGRPDVTKLFQPKLAEMGEPRAMFHSQPSFADDLTRRGRFDRDWLQLSNSYWSKPLNLVLPL
ncbi:CpaF family protein [Streptomyces sp. A7024]|uniref:CpaF family protein n=1 Tax=Streptomyces coryli TaxID=1128680 RepID=A0A6G4TTK7_9ACTN|nr:ATPase, T2SS/T4P/T4SS family [Streptomyces coryli]NGN63204.1 CpaF family protein [Streptomyces coryli]